MWADHSIKYCMFARIIGDEPSFCINKYILCVCIVCIQKLLGAQGNEEEACRRISPAPFQTTRNTDNLEALALSLQYLASSTKGLRDSPWVYR
jgi:hypothetical protein